MKRAWAVFAVAAIVLTGSIRAESARLEVIDPLTLPPPNQLELVLPGDARPASDKIVGRLWEKAAAGEPGEAIEVIVTLHEPLILEAAKLDETAREALRVENVAAVEHSFAGKATALGAWDLQGLSHVPIVFLKAQPSLLSRLAALPEVRALQDNAPMELSRTQGASLMKADVLRTTHGGAGNGIGVAIVDSGVDATHPELSSRVVAWQDLTGTTGDGRIDGNGHGTSVAGIVAGVSGGMAPQATIWAMKVFTNDGSGNNAWTLAALNSLYANRALFGGLDLVNMSLGNSSTERWNSDCDAQFPAEAAVVNQLVGAGIAVFAASGNSAQKDGIKSPACLSNVISVGAVYDANVGPGTFDVCTEASSAADKITCYSNSGPPLDILAPSHCAWTPHPGGVYNTCFGGTSAASPYAAGVAAQILSLRPGTSPAALRSALMTTGKPITDVNGITRGRVEAVAAYQALVPNTGPCVEDTTTACLLNSRFRARVRYRNGFDNGLPDTYALRKPVTGFANPNFETEFFYFNDVNNIEVLLKMLDQGNVDPQGYPTIAVLFGSATPLRLEITITDTQKGVTRTYSNQFGSQQGSTDFTAFRK